MTDTISVDQQVLVKGTRDKEKKSKTKKPCYKETTLDLSSTPPHPTICNNNTMETEFLVEMTQSDK